MLTKSELSQLYYLNREIDSEKRKLQALHDTQTGSTAEIMGLPHIETLTDRAVLLEEIKECHAAIEAKVLLSIVEYNRLSRYIATIDDSLLRQVLSYRFVSGLSWRQVAVHIGGNNTADGVRMICKRFLDEK